MEVTTYIEVELDSYIPFSMFEWPTLLCAFVPLGGQNCIKFTSRVRCICLTSIANNEANHSE